LANALDQRWIGSPKPRVFRDMISRALKQFQVLKPIIGLIPILVMDHLTLS
jgi:hypothetical protein